ncbi:dihydrofolate reductase-like [Arapaima gigas]
MVRQILRIQFQRAKKRKFKKNPAMSRTLSCIVAVCPDMGIGYKGHLPWHPKKLSNELKYFQKMTMTPTVQGKENVVIMGRKTWFSIPETNRPLPNRINIVLSQNLKYPPAGAHYLASDFDSALHLLDTEELADKVDQVWVIGGGSLYQELMESSSHHRLFVTRVLQQFHCDTFMPTISLDKYQLLPEFPGVPQDLQEEEGIQYKMEVVTVRSREYAHGPARLHQQRMGTRRLNIEPVSEAEVMKPQTRVHVHSHIRQHADTPLGPFGALGSRRVIVVRRPMRKQRTRHSVMGCQFIARLLI